MKIRVCAYCDKERGCIDCPGCYKQICAQCWNETKCSNESDNRKPEVIAIEVVE